MRRMSLALVALVAAALPLVFAPSPALACSCAGEPGPLDVEFAGVAVDTPRWGTAGRVWRFRVTSGRGVTSGEVVDVDLDVAFEQDGGLMTSSCSLGDAPVPGQRYRVGAYVGEPNGESRLFANQCGGYFEAAAVAVPHEPRSKGPPSPLLAAGAAALAAAIVIGIKSARS